MKKTLHLFGLLVFAGSAMAVQQPNVLFIAVDDLRPELGCYGSDIAISPNLDELADDGMLFTHAYCQQAICGPSRASLMTGARPDTIGVVENYAHYRDKIPDIITLPQQFLLNGYETAYCGKIFHGKDTDDAHSWSRKPATKKVKVKKLKGGFALQKNKDRATENRETMIARYGEDARKNGLGRGPAYECADVPDYAYEDGWNTLAAIETMKEMVQGDKPFFLGLGFKRPHLDWVAPKRYWDMYDRATIPLSSQLTAPEKGAAMGLHASFELRVRDGIPKDGKPFDEDLERTLKHAYLACVSYVDAQIGKMLAALDEAGVRDNTIIIVWGDHGWHLGDMGVWGKATNYEVGTRVPLLIWTPDMPKGSRGKKCDGLVELVDMYPTLCDLANVPLPAHLEGTSFKPLLSNPERSWKTAAFSQFPTPALREWAANPLSQGLRETFFGPLISEVEGRIKAQQKGEWNRELFEKHLMGYAMRTDRYRLVLWKDYRHPEKDPIFVELYDHVADPLETRNIADRCPEKVAVLIEQFNKGWNGNRPVVK
ncbi:sulfatase [Pontiella agarivorans]|uniref:Sulfatase n=1 Tax=Pontiella agarivorans TaxID=3038953 RepID=A0ABU5MSG0_9BACT|nr:sulfatase [Pontiella agarivorans]